MTPGLGSMVHYCDFGVTDCRAAFVAHVELSGRVNLAVLGMTGESSNRLSVGHGGKHVANTWHFASECAPAQAMAMPATVHTTLPGVNADGTVSTTP